MNRKPLTAAITGIVAGALLLTSCSSSSPEPGEGGGAQEFRIIATEPSAGLDPAIAVTQASLRVMELMYDTLIDYDEDNNLIPMIAEDWEMSDDGLTYVFTLRDASFSDGSAITAADVVYSIERAAASEALGGRLAALASVEATGDLEVTMTLSEPSRVFLGALAATGSAAILKQEAVEADPDYFTQPTATSGPWQLEENVQQSHATLRANESYWNEDLTLFDTITYTYSTDTTAMAAAVETGTADMTYNMRPADAVRLDDAGTIQFFEAPSPGILSWGLDKTRPPFDDVDVRQAVAYLAPRADRLTTCWSDIGPVSFGDLIFEGQDFYSEGEQRFDIDADDALSKAEDLLDEAGWVPGADGIREKDGVRFALEVPYENTWTQARCNTEMLQQALLPAGIDITPVAYDRANFWTDVAADKFQMYHAGNNYATVDAYFQQTYTCEGSANELIAKWCNEDVDALIAQAIASSDTAEVTDLYRQVQDIVLDEQPTITTGAQYAVIGASPKLTGYYPRADASNRALMYATLAD
ncbi:ABC transporter substrate-binding protein [Microbacterium pseudoresistens]|uniref:Peptide/nickel transport system substrate-binding protein n=1 Tax=Microbacterium pseudoresistens TaxID=640634 RepID=A0A7Y9ESV6_9MICO|nr:ABC transporter substrate-binding protein [Microbacterium pseudoresistens]NYD53298.1 peptide/nickel transport system substrate-binding protein [Microbacterium pseudoresistens]